MCKSIQTKVPPEKAWIELSYNSVEKPEIYSQMKFYVKSNEVTAASRRTWNSRFHGIFRNRLNHCILLLSRLFSTLINGFIQNNFTNLIFNAHLFGKFIVISDLGWGTFVDFRRSRPYFVRKTVWHFDFLPIIRNMLLFFKKSLSFQLHLCSVYVGLFIYYFHMCGRATEV